MTLSSSINGRVRTWRRYPAYKDSGVEWYEPIPAHWSLKPTKYACSMNTESLGEATQPDYELEYVDIGNVSSEGVILSTQRFQFENAPSRARKKVRHGDTIISTVRTYLKAIAHIADPADNLIVSTGFAVLRPNGVLEPRFLWRSVQAHEYVEKVVIHSTGIGYPAIAPTTLATLPLWVPPPDEQRSIVAFLDRETAKIDALIAKKERLIELLQEKRTALVSHAVTKGLDRSNCKRESPITGLGLVPHSWEETSVKRLISYITSGSRGWAEHYADEGDLFIQSGNLNRRLGLDLSNVQRVQPPSGAEVARTLIQRDDVLVCVTGAYTGNVALVDVDLPRAFVNQHVALLRPIRSKVAPKFLAYLLASAYGAWHFRVSQYGGTIVDPENWTTS